MASDDRHQVKRLGSISTKIQAYHNHHHNPSYSYLTNSTSHHNTSIIKMNHRSPTSILMSGGHLLLLLLSTTIIQQVVVMEGPQLAPTHHHKRASSQVPCPTACTCKWTSGKPSAFCDNKLLDSLPVGIDSEIQVLDLSNNNIQSLPSRVFQKHKLTNLQRINLSRTNLALLEDDAFMQLTNLVELDLSFNSLTRIPVSATRDCKQLRKLNLSNNPIGIIETNSFSALTELISLDLSGCLIDQIESSAFYGLNNLKELRLTENRLTTLRLSAVADLPPNIYLDLTQNPWNCDCNLRAVREWYSNGNIQAVMPPTCATPAKVTDVMWISLKLEDFACAPEIIPGNTDVTVAASTNVSLSCSVKASMPVSFVWFQDERNLTAKKNQSEPPSTTQLLEERRYDIYETVGPPSFPNVSTSVLTLHNLKPSDTSTFLCWAENKAGYSITNFTLTVTEPGTVADMWPVWSRKTEGTSTIFIIFAISIVLTTLLVILLVRRRTNNNNNNKIVDHDMKPTANNLKNGSASLAEDDDSASTDSSDSSTRKPQISSIGLDVIEHMKTGIINMDYHSMSPIIQFNNTGANKNTSNNSIGNGNNNNNNNSSGNDTLLRKKATTNEIHIQPDFNHLSVNWNNQSANSSYNCDLTSSSTTGYHSDYNSGYSDEPNSGPNFNMPHQTNLSHDQQNLITINNNLNNRVVIGSTLDRQQQMTYNHNPHYNDHLNHINQPPDITLIHGQNHHYDASGHHLANMYNQDLPNDMTLLANNTIIPAGMNQDMILHGYPVADRTECMSSPPNYSNAV